MTIIFSFYILYARQCHQLMTVCHSQKSVENVIACISASHENKKLLLKNAPVGKFAALYVNLQLYEFLWVNYCPTLLFRKIGHATPLNTTRTFMHFAIIGRPQLASVLSKFKEKIYVAFCRGYTCLHARDVSVGNGNCVGTPIFGVHGHFLSSLPEPPKRVSTRSQ